MLIGTDIRMRIQPRISPNISDWVSSSINAPRLSILIQHRGKDSTVRIWELPEASDDGSPFSQPLAKPPIVLRIQAKSETEGTDITSLAWNPQGTLVAVGGFDSVLRIWTKSGDEYMTNPQHRVCAAISI